MPLEGSIRMIGQAKDCNTTVQPTSDTSVAKSVFEVNENSKVIKQHKSRLIKKRNRVVFFANLFVYSYRIAIVAGSLALMWLALSNPEYIRSLIGIFK